MKDDDDFEKADVAAGVEVLAPARDTSVSRPSDMIQFRQQLLEEYHKGAPNLLARLKRDGKEDLESTLMAMLEEVILEADHLLGNELVATQNGDLRDASVIGFKRTEVFEKAMRAIQTKQQLEKQSGIDVESPSMMVIFRFFMSKSKETFEKMGVGDELSNLFFRKFGEVTNDWKKELRSNFEALRTQK